MARVLQVDCEQLLDRWFVFDHQDIRGHDGEMKLW
jgi:hypothetical protein